ncbi:DNA repair protein RAD5B-like [Phragmites australis]|uniref:DNA repair protein RAD5B-like n=1 Tax=Phragmites australis TaxID=29695 RepID=UPI002D78CF53|nr:DNA repair protein RAD5B-like [Phragmites australis]
MTCDGAYRRDPPERFPDQPAVFDDDMAAFRAVLGADLSLADAVDALSSCGGDTERAIKLLLDDAAADSDDGDVEREKGRAGGAAPVAAPRGVKAKRSIGGAAPPPPMKVEAAADDEVKVKREPIDADPDEVKVNAEAPPPGEVGVKVKVEAPGEVEVEVKRERIEANGPFREQVGRRVKQEEEADEVDVKKEQLSDSPIKGQLLSPHRVKEESDCRENEVAIIDPPPRSKKRRRDEDDVAFIDLTTSHPVPYLNPRPVRAMPPPGAMPASEWRMVVPPPPAELDEYPPDRREWCFFKKSYATGLSTCHGRKLLDAGEVVHFAFPSYNRFHGGIRVSVKQAAALAEIVRFSTNRSGEIGKLSSGCAKCLAPLVSSSKIMIQGKVVFPMVELRLMQEVLLYVSFYIHRSSMYLIAPENAHHPGNPLRGLFKLLRRFGGAED